MNNRIKELAKRSEEIDRIKNRIIDYIKKTGTDARIAYVPPITKSLDGQLIKKNSEEYYKNHDNFMIAIGEETEIKDIETAIKELLEEKKIWRRNKKGERRTYFYNLIENPVEIFEHLEKVKGIIDSGQKEILDSFQSFLIKNNGSGNFKACQTCTNNIEEVEKLKTQLNSSEYLIGVIQGEKHDLQERLQKTIELNVDLHDELQKLRAYRQVLKDLHGQFE